METKNLENLRKKYNLVWDNLKENTLEEMFKFCEGYKSFLNASKTEREASQEIVKIAEENGFVDLKTVITSKNKLALGSKVYAVNKDKGVVMFILGTEPMENGMSITGSHLDSPRIDLKQNPLYEEEGFAFLETHYYGGIKKYQWVTIPLSIHGVVITKDGKKINVVIGEEDNDPVLFITDLLPHLAKDQSAKKLSEAIEGENLNVLFGSMPIEDSKAENRIKLNVLRLLNEKYGIEEEDFTSAELEIVPSGKSRDVGLDRSMFAAYGHDD